MSNGFINYKFCFVPECNSSTIRTPDKLFLSSPLREPMRSEWIKACTKYSKESFPMSSVSRFYCCEDHFDLEKDLLNWKRYCMYKVRIVPENMALKPGVLPHKFECQNVLTPQPSRLFLGTDGEINSHVSGLSRCAQNENKQNKPSRLVPVKIKPKIDEPACLKYDLKKIEVKPGLVLHGYVIQRDRPNALKKKSIFCARRNDKKLINGISPKTFTTQENTRCNGMLPGNKITLINEDKAEGLPIKVSRVPVSMCQELPVDSSEIIEIDDDENEIHKSVHDQESHVCLEPHEIYLKLLHEFKLLKECPSAEDIKLREEIVKLTTSSLTPKREVKNALLNVFPQTDDKSCLCSHIQRQFSSIYFGLPGIKDVPSKSVCEGNKIESENVSPSDLPVIVDVSSESESEEEKIESENISPPDLPVIVDVSSESESEEEEIEFENVSPCLPGIKDVPSKSVCEEKENVSENVSPYVVEDEGAIWITTFPLEMENYDYVPMSSPDNIKFDPPFTIK